LLHIIFLLQLPNQLVANLESFIALCTELTNCAAFNRGNLTFWRCQKLYRTNSVKDKKRKHRICEHFFELEQVLKMASTRIHVLSQLLSKTRDSFAVRKILPCFLHYDI